MNDSARRDLYVCAVAVAVLVFCWGMGGIGPMIDPEQIIVSVTGVTDWRPQFVLGLQAAFVFAFVVGFGIALLVWYGRR